MRARSSLRFFCLSRIILMKNFFYWDLVKFWSFILSSAFNVTELKAINFTSRSYLAISKNLVQFILPLRQKLHPIYNIKKANVTVNIVVVSERMCFHCALISACFLQHNFPHANQRIIYGHVDEIPTSMELLIAIFHCPFASFLTNEEAFRLCKWEHPFPFASGTEETTIAR